jgi:hypothetical protein
MRTLSWPLRFLLLFCLLLSFGSPALAQALDYQYFDETGHNVQGAFLQFYRQASNPTLLYGYPITEEFTRPDGLRVQYFQRARFEYNQRVSLTSLGAELYKPSNPVNVYSPLACRYFAETGYSVCFEFREFFDANGGFEQFGLPISAFENHEGTIVQYFEKARLEWQPWREAGQRVVISDLGRIYFDKAHEDPGLLPPAQPLNAIIRPLVLSLQVRAFVQKAVTLGADEQTIYIIARDQRGQPLSDAECTTDLTWPDGRFDSANSLTGAHGLALLPFTFSGQPQGQLVYAQVTCAFGGLSSRTYTSFRIWY